MTVMLVRFAIIAGAVVIAVVAGFTILTYLKRRGKLHDARRYVDPVVRGMASGGPGRRGGIKRVAARSVLGYLDRETDGKR